MRRDEKPIRSERRSTIREGVCQRGSKVNGEKQPEVQNGYPLSTDL